MFEGFVEWLQSTPLSATLADTTQLSTWVIVPLSQAVHILAVAIVMMAAGAMNLRLLSTATSAQSFSQLTLSFMPWVWTALIVLFLTGTIQTIAEPGRELLNSGFKAKMLMLTAALAIMLAYERTARRDADYWERSHVRRATARLLAMVSILLWIGIAAAGRMIAYVDTSY